MAVRKDGRQPDQVRPIKITYGVYGNAQGSVLFEMGNTRVLCSIMLQDGVPHFLRSSGQGWLTAEYTLLPASTVTRTAREASVMRRNSRSIEISRLIGRSLRAVLDLKKLGEKTIYVDCDVLQADGGTRTASISGAYCALQQAIEQWIVKGIISTTLFKESVAAVSVGWVNNTALLDVDFTEDSTVDADFNFVMTGSGKIIEIQGATEINPIDWASVLTMQQVALQGVNTILKVIETTDHSFSYAKTTKEIQI
ncbi:MAG: ribonuclease PH [Proteobacteria bacterium]|nr:ribonuclease PH [Pseudomonadota bacterium]NBP15022.1 ribonuclease PH [bacterium]